MFWTLQVLSLCLWEITCSVRNVRPTTTILHLYYRSCRLVSNLQKLILHLSSPMFTFDLVLLYTNISMKHCILGDFPSVYGKSKNNLLLTIVDVLKFTLMISHSVQRNKCVHRFVRHVLTLVLPHTYSLRNRPLMTPLLLLIMIPCVQMNNGWTCFNLLK